MSTEASMRAAIYTTKGPAAEVLRVIDKPVPEPGAGEVRVRIAFSGVNPSDVKSRAGVASRAGGFPEVTPHSDGAGCRSWIGWPPSPDHPRHPTRLNRRRTCGQ